ncbi:glutathione S-transferase family protein [Colwellia sp. RE-S-Sl-9]
MPIITPTYKPVTELKGLHLYHAGISNCSMRVRIVLEEKKLAWVSHHLDLVKREHITEEYFGINPNGVVPTLVHDGKVIIESDDIIEYLDAQFPEVPLCPKNLSDLNTMKWWLSSAIEIHVKAIKTYIYYKKIRGKMQMSKEQEQKYKSLQTNTELLRFHDVSSSDNGFSDEEINQAESIIKDFFYKANEILKDQTWLAGESFSLADVAWVPLHFTLKGAGFSFNEFPEVEAWAEKIAVRESFKKGVLDWCPTF